MEANASIFVITSILLRIDQRSCQIQKQSFKQLLYKGRGEYIMKLVL